MRLWDLDEADLPEIAWPVRAVFMPRRRPASPPSPGVLLPKDFKKTDRNRNESLHDYLTRKNISCFCRACVKVRKLASVKNNTSLL